MRDQKILQFSLADFTFFVSPKYLFTTALLFKAGVAGLRFSLSSIVERSQLSFLPNKLAGGFRSSFLGKILLLIVRSGYASKLLI